jgi:hypothetical protein
MALTTKAFWCSGECESFIVKQFVVILPGKTALEKLTKDKSYAVYLICAVSSTMFIRINLINVTLTHGLNVCAHPTVQEGLCSI